MAGFIVFKSGDWKVSGGGFRAMVHGVIPHLPANPIGVAVRDLLTFTVDSEVLFLDATREFDIEMLRAFDQALQAHLIEARALEHHQWPNPDLHEGYLARLTELRDMLRGELSE